MATEQDMVAAVPAAQPQAECSSRFDAEQLQRAVAASLACTAREAPMGSGGAPCDGGSGGVAGPPLASGFDAEATEDGAGDLRPARPAPPLYPALWALILFRLAELGDAEHFATIERNERNFAEALRKRPNEQTLVEFEFAMPCGFGGAIRQVAVARLVCKHWHALLENNTWWYTFWTKRGIADIRCFKPVSVTWWEVAARFCAMREKARVKLEETHPLTRMAYISANNRGLAWSLLREFRCALIDYSLSNENCVDPTQRNSQVFRMCSNVSVVYIKIADFPRALAHVDRCVQMDSEQNPASALNNRAVALIHLHRFAEAKCDLERSMEYDKLLPNSRLHMAYCLFREEDYQGCLEYCEKAEAISNYPAVYLMKAHALEALGRADEAEAVMNHCIMSAWEAGPYKAIFVHQLPVKHPNYSW